MDVADGRVSEGQPSRILSRISIEQFNPVTGDIYRNADQIVKRMLAAKERGSLLTVFTELAVTGYCMSDLIEDGEFLEANKEVLDRIATASKGIISIVGFVDFDPTSVQEDGRVKKYNSAAVFCDGKLVKIVNKQLLPNYRYFDDKRYFTPGDFSEVVEVELAGEKIKLGVTVCEDIWNKFYHKDPVTELCDQGAELIICLNASPTHPKKFEQRDEIIRGHIAANHVPFVYANTVGAADIGKTIICFDGESLAYDAEGNLVAQAARFKEESLAVDVNNLSAQAISSKRPSRAKHLFETIVMGTRDYARKSGFSKAIVPVSGGIDSALGLAVAVAAFGKENVTAYNLPSKFNTDTTRSIAKQLADNFGVKYKVIPIQGIDDVTRSDFETHNHKIEKNVTKENLHARIRGLIMMAESNDTGSILISCGNKTEIALGYCTLYGDMCGGISVIGDLDKKDVYAVSRYVNESSGGELIPNATFTIVPSAELSEGQYDPFDYDIVSPLVNEFVVKRKGLGQLLKEFEDHRLEFPADDQGRTLYDKHSLESFSGLVNATYRLIRTSVYKRLQGPPIISTTERTFGFDLREPLINGWKGRQLA